MIIQFIAMKIEQIRFFSKCNTLRINDATMTIDES